MGQLIMLGTLFGLIVLIFGLVLYFDPEARGGAGEESRPMNTEMTPLLTALRCLRMGQRHRVPHRRDRT